MRPLLFLLTRPVDRYETTRCCDDRPHATVPSDRPAWPLRWPRKLHAAAGPSFAVFRRQMSQPVSATVDAGTPVISSSGREVGTVSSLVVELPSGRASYAVTPEAAEGRVLLLPRDALRPAEDSAVVEERVLHRLARKSA